MAKRRRKARREAARAAIHESGGGAPIVPTRGFHSFVNHNKLNELFDGETARLDRSESPTKRDKKINPSSLLDSWVSCEWRLFFVSCILLFFHILTRASAHRQDVGGTSVTRNAAAPVFRNRSATTMTINLKRCVCHYPCMHLCFSLLFFLLIFFFFSSLSQLCFFSMRVICVS